MRIEMAPSDPNQNFSEPWGGVSISFLRVGLRACCWTHEENRPNLHYVDSRITIQYARRYSTGYLHFPRSKNIPPFTRSFHFLDEKHSLCSQFSIRRIFNTPENIESSFHSRDGFRDDELHTGASFILGNTPSQFSMDTSFDFESLQSPWKRILDVKSGDYIT